MPSIHCRHCRYENLSFYRTCGKCGKPLIRSVAGCPPYQNRHRGRFSSATGEKESRTTTHVSKRDRHSFSSPISHGQLQVRNEEEHASYFFERQNVGEGTNSKYDGNGHIHQHRKVTKRRSISHLELVAQFARLENRNLEAANAIEGSFSTISIRSNVDVLDENSTRAMQQHENYLAAAFRQHHSMQQGPATFDVAKRPKSESEYERGMKMMKKSVVHTMQVQESSGQGQRGVQQRRSHQGAATFDLATRQKSGSAYIRGMMEDAAQVMEPQGSSSQGQFAVQQNRPYQGAASFDVTTRPKSESEYETGTMMKKRAQAMQQQEYSSQSLSALQQNRSLHVVAAAATTTAFFLARRPRSEVSAAETESEKGMMENALGRAWKFVEELKRLVSDLKGQFPTSKLSLLALDDIVFLADRFILCQRWLGNCRRPMRVTCGYHYTNSRNLCSIRQDGLMSRSERETLGIRSKSHGSYFGDGIYIGINPFSFQDKGDVGLLVAMLKGAEQIVGPGPPPHPAGIDSYIGNKVQYSSDRSFLDTSHYTEVVLRRSAQCLPLFQFHCPLFGSATANTCEKELLAAQASLQGLLDRFFNNE